MRQIFTVLQASLRILLHSSLLATVFWFVVALVLSHFLATQFSARQVATTALDVGVSILRLSLPILIVLLTQELVTREFERKSYLNSLTYPRSRTTWLLGRMLATLLVSLVTLTGLGILLALLSILAGSIYQQATPISLGLPYLITLGAIALDAFVIAAIAILIGVNARTPSFVLLGTLGFTLIARSYGPIIELLSENPATVDGFADPGIYQDSLGLLAFLLPDLGRLDIRMIALYDNMAFLPSDWPLLVVSTLAYAVALIGLSIWVLNRREFN